MLSRLAGGRYELEAVLGEGGMAAVWRALDTRLGRPVAIKMLDQDAAADPLRLGRLADEARTVARLVHPNIVAVFDLGNEQGVPYLVMELVNDSLRARLDRGPLEVAKAVALGTQICDALDAAHSAGVVHRDIKPDNVLLTAADVVKVCDFGVAHLQPTHLAAGVRGARPAFTVGTSGYMAPEQAAGGPLDQRTDLYALGCVLYEMLTGNPPFAGTDLGQLAWQQLHEPPPSVASRRPDVPAELDALIVQLLATNPEDRPATAALVRARLATVDATPASGSAPMPAVGPSMPRAESRGDPRDGDPRDGDPGDGDPRDGGPGLNWVNARSSERKTAQWTRGAHRAPLASARAAVVTRTQTMPAVDLGDAAPPSRNGIRLGPAGIAAVAIGAAAVTAVLIAAILLGQSAQQLAAPAAGTSVAASTTTTPSASPTQANGLEAVRAAILAQVDADRLDSDKADDLLDRLTEIEGYLAEGDTEKAADKVADFRRRLDELRRDRNLSMPGYRAIVNSLGQADLPDTGRRDRD